MVNVDYAAEELKLTTELAQELLNLQADHNNKSGKAVEVYQLKKYKLQKDIAETQAKAAVVETPILDM